MNIFVSNHMYLAASHDHVLYQYCVLSLFFSEYTEQQNFLQILDSCDMIYLI